MYHMLNGNAPPEPTKHNDFSNVFKLLQNDASTYYDYTKFDKPFVGLGL